MSEAEVLPLRADAPATYAAAVEAYMTSAGIGASSRRIYRISLTTWTGQRRGQLRVGVRFSGHRPVQLVCLTEQLEKLPCTGVNPAANVFDFDQDGDHGAR
jgi:hypothetical protein